MAIEICAVGGYNEVGQNMTAIRVDDEVIICDMGIHLENYISYTDNKDNCKLSKEELVEVNAIPNDSLIHKWKPLVKAIIPSHAHLDHIAAIPYLEKDYTAPIIGTPFSIAVLKILARENKQKFKNKVIDLNPNSSFKISENITIEFINVTHSTPQTVMIVVHTKYGAIIYANDFKFDNHPTLGKKPNYKRLKEIGKKGVVALICESTYAKEKNKMPSELIAKEMIKDIFLNTIHDGKVMVITTFSSHLARIKTIIEYGKKINRTIVLLGRSLSKYIEAGQQTGIIQIPKDVIIVKYSSKIKRFISTIKNKKKYLFVVTGHQGETKAVLSKMAKDEIKFNFNPGDLVIFSCTVIPTETNKINREELESDLEKKKVRIFRDIHVSGHGAKEDSRDLILMTKPKYVIPSHGFDEMKNSLKELCLEMDYDEDHIINLNNQEKKILE